jgi:hypothetical protein
MHDIGAKYAVVIGQLIKIFKGLEIDWNAYLTLRKTMSRDAVKNILSTIGICSRTQEEFERIDFYRANNRFYTDAEWKKVLAKRAEAYRQH